MHFSKQIGLIILLLTISFNGIAQISKGDEYFGKMEYKNAIAAYQKALKKGKGANDPQMLSRLADAFRLIKDYSNAATYYKQAVLAGNVNAETHLHYASILKSIGKYDEAEIHYKKALELKPGNIIAINGIKSCQNVKNWRVKPKEYEVTNLEKLNSDKSEFSPVVWNNKLVFVAERESDLIDFTHYSYNDRPYLNVFSASLKDGNISSPEPLSKKLNTAFHDGPVCFSSDGATLFFTRVKYEVKRKQPEFVNRAAIYSASFQNGNLKKAEVLPFAGPHFSVAHPSISADGKTLFFASDMPGGYGGMDIYSSVFNNGTWETPKNLGPDINTSGSEEFPFIRKDGTLFFSSDGLAGFGGLDIFSAKNISGKWILSRNEGAGINDITDDFGVYFTSDNEGYFSSDRPGGKGSDDIYKFKYTNKSEILEGYVLFGLDTAKGAADQLMILTDSTGAKLSETRSDKRGYFRFDNLESEKNYMVKMDEEDPSFTDYPRYYYADKDGNIMRGTKDQQKIGKFVFSALPLRDNAMSDIESDDDFTVAGNVLFGDKNTPVANTRLLLKDEKGHILEETTTNALGSFAFRKLPAGSNYLIEMADEDSSLPPDAKITVTNKNGKEIRVIRADSKGRFQIKVLSKEENFISEMNAEDKDLVMDVSGIALSPDKKAIAGSKVFLLNEKGEKIAEAVTGKDGTFTFRNLPSSKNYLISLDTDDPALSGYEKVFIADKNGKVLKELKRLNQFRYKLLQSDKTVLSEIYVDDPWLEVIELKNKTQTKQDSITIIESVYYASGDWKFDDNGKRVLDKVVKIMKDNPLLVIELSSHTDSKADDAFNLKLSDKRARHAVDYIIRNGIRKTRVTAVGYGESKLINNCGNGVDCSDEQHAQNRRTEFKIVEAKK